MSTEQQKQLALRIQYLKLKRITELNNKLRGELTRERITASNACLAIINYTSNHTDYTLPEIWGYIEPGKNHLRSAMALRNRHGSSTHVDDGGCCTIS